MQSHTLGAGARSKSIVLASSNQGKLAEFRELLCGEGFQIASQSEFLISAPEETGLSFVENALIKARHASKLSGIPAIADDSGLEVDALRGAPGIHSARFAGATASEIENIQKLLSNLADVPESLRSGRFRCVIVYMQHPNDPSPLIAQGVWKGIILSEPKGQAGFGYDPIFWVPELNKSAAELSRDEKNRLSHRGQALRALLTQLRGH